MPEVDYCIRVGDSRRSPLLNLVFLNYWRSLSHQRVWGFPKSMIDINLRANFEADVEDAQTKVTIWFLHHGDGKQGDLLQKAIATQSLREGPVRNPDLLAVGEMRDLDLGYDHWFEWKPLISKSETLGLVQESLLPCVPSSRVLYPFSPLTQKLIGSEEQQAIGTVSSAGVPAALLAALVADLAAALPTPPALPVASPPALPPALPLALPPALPSPSVPALPIASSAALLARGSVPPTGDDNVEEDRHNQAHPHSPGFLYLIHMENTTFYKIGKSVDPRSRLRTLQTGNPQPLYLLNTQPVRDMRKAEQFLHLCFAHERVPNLGAREWYDLSPRHVQALVDAFDWVGSGSLYPVRRNVRTEQLGLENSRSMSFRPGTEASSRSTTRDI